MSKTVGYARVSSVGQSLEVQLEKLKAFGCHKVYKEKRSGVDTNRPELKKALDYVREGDVLVVTKLDRLARSTLDLHKIIAGLEEKEVGFQALDQPSMNTTSKEGKLLFSILASIAEFETELRKERQMEGILKAKQRGVHLGRRPSLTDEQIQELKEKRSKGVLIKDLMQEFNLSKTSVYRLLG